MSSYLSLSSPADVTHFFIDLLMLHETNVSTGTLHGAIFLFIPAGHWFVT